jgi:hypothetical protein
MKKKTTSLTPKKKQILRDLEKSVKWVKLHRQGKAQAKSIEQILDEL